MGLPVLVQQAAHYEKPTADQAQAAPATSLHGAHHPGMHHGAMPPVAHPAVPAPAPRLAIADCFVQQTCCSFNREPGRKSEPYSAGEARVDAVRKETATITLPAAAEACFGVAYAKPVFDLKADLRI